MKPQHSGKLNGGTQDLYMFDNGYGASVIKGGMYAYGGYELAVIKFIPQKGFGAYNIHEYKLCYDTPITDDVIGHLNDSKCKALLEQIKNLPIG